ncbi:MAG: hypothetical protein AUJ82_08245 [Verrucomicrobia bacterium CG1_02_43_26]|nr:MAG: hypothetical protein AUJ82_08245 [Verrucomicrobia bacterium CG1_02_43_26]
MDKVAKEYKSAITPVDASQWDMVQNYLPLVKSIVSRMRVYFPEHIEMREMYSIGIIGLISAVQNYDAKKANSFGAYAKIRVRGSLLDELRRMDWLPRADRVNLKKYRKAVEELEQKIQREASEDEICEALGITKKEHAHLKNLQMPLTHVSLDSAPAAASTDSTSLHEVICDLTELNSRDVAENHELIDLLKDSLKELPEMQRKVLALYYIEELRLAEIAAVFDLTESRICQIHAQALGDLRTSLKQKMIQ